MRGEAEQHGANIEDVGDRVQRDADHERAAPRPELDQPALRQCANGLAHRTVTDVEQRGDPLLGKMLAVAEFALDDRNREVVGNLLGDRARAQRSR